MKVGLKVYPPEHVKEIIEAKDRYMAGPKAPAKGLTLVGIEYQEQIVNFCNRNVINKMLILYSCSASIPMIKRHNYITFNEKGKRK